MLGAGLTPTKEFFTALGTEEAREVLDDLASVEQPYDAHRYAAYLDDYHRAV